MHSLKEHFFKQLSSTLLRPHHKLLIIEHYCNERIRVHWPKNLVKSRKVRGYFLWIINAEFWAELFLFRERVGICFFHCQKIKRAK